MKKVILSRLAAGEKACVLEEKVIALLHACRVCLKSLYAREKFCILKTRDSVMYLRLQLRSVDQERPPRQSPPPVPPTSAPQAPSEAFTCVRGSKPI